MDSTSLTDLTFTMLTSLASQIQVHSLIIFPLFKLVLNHYLKMKTTFFTPIAALLLTSMTVAAPNHKMIFDCINDGLGGISFSGPSLSPYLVPIKLTRLINLTHTDVCDNMCFGNLFSNSFYRNSTLSACSLNSEDNDQFPSQVHFVRIGVQPSLGTSPQKAQEAKGAPKQAVGPGTVAARARMATVTSATSTLSSQWRNPMQVVRSTDVSSRDTIMVCTLSCAPIQDTRTICDNLLVVLPRTWCQLTNKPAQSQVIRQFYNSQGSFKGTGCGGTAPCAFSIVFANSGNIDFCDTSSKSCKNDGNEYTKAGKVPDTSTKPTRRQDANSTFGEGGSYLLKSGQIIVSAQPLDPGDRAVRVKRVNETLFAEYNDLHVPDPEQGLEQYDYMMHNLYLEEDIVVGKV